MLFAFSFLDRVMLNCLGAHTMYVPPHPRNAMQCWASTELAGARRPPDAMRLGRQVADRVCYGLQAYKNI